MPQRTDSFDLPRLGLTSGEGRRLDLHVAIDGFHYGGEPYAVIPPLVPVRVDVSRMTGMGWALRLRFTAGLEGPCMRCLERAQPAFEVDAREVSQPGGGEELTSPYIGFDDEVDVATWARDALALSLPDQILCRPDCAGLCPVCGQNLNEEPHEHAEERFDPRWAALAQLRDEL